MAAAVVLTVAMGGVAGADTLRVACTGPGGGAAGLVAAVAQANASAGPHTVNLAAGCTYALTNPASTDDGLPVVTGQLSIRGHGATIRRAASSPAFRILEVAAGAEVTLDQVTITCGAVSLSGTLALGGGILNSGSLAVTRSAIRHNEVSGTGSSAGGGGIANNGIVTLTDTVLRNNQASSTGTQIFTAVGGAVLNRTGATMTIDTSTVAGNKATAQGETKLFFLAAAGGIGNTGTLNVNDTRIVGNEATATGTGGQANGGGMSVADGTATIVGGALQANTASATGEGAAAHGGALENSARTKLSGTIVRQNQATGPTAQGGAIFNGGGRLAIIDATVTDNAAAATAGAAQGGGIFIDAGNVVLRSTVVFANRPDNCEPTLPGC